jgi:hypothetical protein
MNTRTASPTTSTARPPSPLKEPEAAGYIGMSVSFLRKQRREGKPPEYVRLGRGVRYTTTALDALLENARVEPTRSRA